jgi:hypothetical protein
MASDDLKAAVGSGAEPAAAPSAAAGSAAAGKSAQDDSDPMTWQVPVLCKDCSKGFVVPYRHFQAGVVFHCPHCHGSLVPTSTMYRSVHAAFEAFFARRRVAEEASRVGGGDQAWRDRQARELEEFRAELSRIAQAMRPAGKMVRKGWLASMFS